MPLSSFRGALYWERSGTNATRLGVHFGSASDTPSQDWATDQRFTLPRDVTPGESVSMTITVTAPAAASTYVLRHRVVEETGSWFDQIHKTNVTVVAPPTSTATATPTA